jgi:glycosyltransferase involved in cell wall biosynthesis
LTLIALSFSKSLRSTKQLTNSEEKKMNEPLPRLTVVIPSFQQGKFIERTLKSIERQNYPNLEIILMDGGSKDETMTIVEKHEHLFSKIVSKPDGGQSAAIADGFAMATGDFISWLNSDDTYCDGALLSVGHYLIKNPTAKFIYGNMNYIDENDQITANKKQPAFVLGVMKYAYLTVAQHSAFWSRELYIKSGGVDRKLQFCMDYDLFVRMATIHRARHVNVTIGNFRIHSESKTTNLEQTRLQEDQLVQDRYCSIKPSNPLWPFIRGFYLVVVAALMLANGSFVGRVKARIKNRFHSAAS